MTGLRRSGCGSRMADGVGLRVGCVVGFRMRTVIEICQPERVSKACSIAGKISGVTSTNTPIPALHDLWRAGPFELVNSLHIRIQETPPLRRRSRPDPRRSRILRGAKATFGYGSTLTFLEDIAHVTHAAAKKPLDRARAHPPDRRIYDPRPRPHRGSGGGVRHRGRARSTPSSPPAKPSPPPYQARQHRRGENPRRPGRDAGPRENGHAGTRPPDTLNPDGPEPKDPARPNPHF
jgi:hypothetical protein